jgi:hypothetical protein
VFIVLEDSGGPAGEVQEHINAKLVVFRGLTFHMWTRLLTSVGQEVRTTSPGDCQAEDDGWLVTNSVSVCAPRGRRTSGAVSQS